MAHIAEWDIHEYCKFLFRLVLLRLKSASDSLHRSTHHSLFAEKATCQQRTRKFDNSPDFMQWALRLRVRASFKTECLSECLHLAVNTSGRGFTCVITSIVQAFCCAKLI